MLALVGVFGVYSRWLASQRTQAVNEMMGGRIPAAGSVIAPDLGTVFGIVIIGGSDWMVRESLTPSTGPG